MASFNTTNAPTATDKEKVLMLAEVYDALSEVARDAYNAAEGSAKSELKRLPKLYRMIADDLRVTLGATYGDIEDAQKNLKS